MSEGEPETEMTEWEGRRAGKEQDETGGAEPAGREGPAGPGRAARAASAAARRPGRAGSAGRSGAAAAGAARGVSAGAERGPAGCGSAEAVAQGPGAARGAGMLTARPAAGLQWRSTPPAAMLVTGLVWVAWEGEPGQKRSVPGALGAVPAALAVERMNPSRSHCLGGWGCWGTCSGCPGRCPWDRCSLRR